MKKLIMGGVAAGILGTAGFFIATEGFSHVAEVGHEQVCQNPPEILKASCHDVSAISANGLDNQHDIALAEAWGGAVIAGLGAIGLVVTGAKALGEL